MRSKLLILVSILALGLVLSACMPSTITMETQPQPHVMSVTGMGMTTLTPDIAYIYLGVHTQAESAAIAVSQNNTSAQKVVDAIKNFGIKAEDIRTTNFSIYPSQQYDKDGQPTNILYMVDNTIYVTVRDLTKLGDLLDAAVQAGANNVNSITFDVADKTQALSDARKAAVANAKQQAQELADASGVKLGDITSISYYDSTPIAYDYGKGGGGGASVAAASVPVNPGQLQFTVSVSLTYELK